MNNLLVFLALPVATILLSIVLQKILNNPILVGITFFAIYLIVTYAVFDSDFLIFAIAYAILAYISAVLSCLICNLINRLNENDENNMSDCVCGGICNNRAFEGEIIRPQLIQNTIVDNETNQNRKRINNNCYRYKNRIWNLKLNFNKNKGFYKYESLIFYIKSSKII